MAKIRIVHLCHAIFVLLLFIASGSQVVGEEVTCGGYSTLLFANDDQVLLLCHGSYSKIDRKRLDEWQGCDDGLVQLRDKKTNQVTPVAECGLYGYRQLRLRDNRLEMRLFYTVYPGFDEMPLLVTEFNPVTGNMRYRFVHRFSSCDTKAVQAAQKRIDSAVARPFNGKNYFSDVYGGFYALRDCAMSQPETVHAILARYQSGDNFDGEVAETLGEVFVEVEAISAALKQ